MIPMLCMNKSAFGSFMTDNVIYVVFLAKEILFFFIEEQIFQSLHVNMYIPNSTKTQIELYC